LRKKQSQKKKKKKKKKWPRGVFKVGFETTTK